MRTLAGLLLLLSAGCSALQEIPADVCGNGVVEKGEDCDRFVDPKLGAKLTCAQAGTPHACHYVCMPPKMSGALPEDCPLGWSCGQDGVCRYASGDYLEAPTSPTKVIGEGFELGDFDGDGRFDVISWLGPKISVLFGDRSGGFGDPSSIEVDVRTDSPRVADLDGDQTSDLIVPSDRGLVLALGQRATEITPVAFTDFDRSVFDTMTKAHVRYASLRTSTTAISEDVLWIYSVDRDFVMSFNPLRRTVITELQGRDVDTMPGTMAVADLDHDGSDEIALPFKQFDQLPIYTSRCAAVRPDGSCGGHNMTSYRTINLGGPIDRGVLFADVDGDGNTDVLASLASDQVAIAYGTAEGGFEDKDHAKDKASPYDPLLALMPPWPLAAADLNGDGHADFVDSMCIYLSVTGTTAGKLEPTCLSAVGPWTEAVIADFDRDGFLDVAAVNLDLPGIDVLFGTGSHFFNRTRIETEGVPSMLRAGDYDGDRAADLAFIDTIPGVADKPVHLSVIYGVTGGLPGRPVVMGRFKKVDEIEAGFLTPFDHISDILLAARSDLESPYVLFTGTERERMLAPLPMARPAQAANDALRSIFVGRFDGMDAHLDLLAFGTLPPGVRSTGTDEGARLREPGIWMVPADPVKLFDPKNARFVPGAEITRDGYCVESYLPLCGPAASIDLDDDHVDEVVTINTCLTPQTLRVYRLHPGSAGAFTLSCMGFQLPNDLGTPKDLELADVDADGQIDAIVTMGASDRPGPSVFLFWGAPDQFVPFDMTPSSIQVDPTAHPTASITLKGDAAPGRQIAVLTDVGVFIAKLLPGSRKFSTSILVTGPSSGAAEGSIRAADVNRDGLADLVYSDGEMVRVFLAVPHGQETQP